MSDGFDRTFLRAAFSLLAALYFASMFFVAFPAALLWATGADLLPRFGGARALGLAPILVGNLVVVRLVVRFVRDGRGTQVPFAPPKVLVHEGLFRRTRNPMYLAYVVIILGEAILFASWMLVAYALACWALAHLYVVRFEEPHLRRRFGAGYDEYCRAVPRWL
jgi:protein-S-isoprenylcysteine O-methyltransferase Ste14